MIQILGVENFPIFDGPFDLTGEIISCLERESHEIEDGDILVIAHKIISKSEGQIVDLSLVEPSDRSVEIAEQTGKDARLVEVILSESSKLIRVADGHIITQHSLGYICANAAVDKSNSGMPDHVLLLPKDPDESARQIRNSISERFGADVAVIVADTHGRAFRIGAMGTCIGIAGMSPLLHLQGRKDLDGYSMETTIEAIADELCAAATLAMGQCDEGIPLTLIKGFEYEQGEGSYRELLMTDQQDLFRKQS
jgi:coenzyme F420-0:L-glutamate ligase/coenzyme F420-1:gamma-L-glutamate ligase